MIIQAQGYRYSIPKRHKVTHETYTRRYALANLEVKLTKERQNLECLPKNQRRRQRGKIWRIEQRIDNLRLLIEAKT